MGQAEERKKKERAKKQVNFLSIKDYSNIIKVFYSKLAEVFIQRESHLWKSSEKWKYKEASVVNSGPWKS